MSEIADRLARALAERYRLDRELGAGGMATNFLAHDMKHDRHVAVRVLQPDLGATLDGERFLSRIRTAAWLQASTYSAAAQRGRRGRLRAVRRHAPLDWRNAARPVSTREATLCATSGSQARCSLMASPSWCASWLSAA